MRVAIVTFGCRLNRAESLDLEARLVAAGHEISGTGAGEKPDCIVVRGCSVTAKAQRDSEKAIAALKRKFPAATVVPAGCLPSAAPEFLELLEISAENPASESAAVPMSSSRAYLKVQDGCSSGCTYCIVPHFRGKPFSVPFAECIARAKAFIAAGYREIVVTGCNLALYRDSGRDLADLLSALAEIPAPDGSEGELQTAPGIVHRIRTGSLEPGLLGGRIAECLAVHRNICRFLHLSLQSGSDRILKLMGRHYTAGSVKEFCENIRRTIGGNFAFGADAIAGFPGETEEDHAATMELLSQETGGLPIFTNVHAFPYSERPGTPAALMPDQVPAATRRARAKQLQELGRKNAAAFAMAALGRTVTVCAEKDGYGRTGGYLHVKAPPGTPRRRLAEFVLSFDDL